MSQELFTRAEVVELVASQLVEQELARKFEASERERTRRFDALRDEMNRRSTSAETARELAKVDAYRAERIASLRDPKPEADHWGLLPELIDLVQGNSREEVDQSIAVMLEKTKSVVESVWEARQ